MSRRATSGGSLLLGWPVRHTAPSQEEQKMKDAVFSLSLIFTFLLGVWNIVNNYRMARRTAFINTVTAERIKWIEKLRDNISSFCGLTHTWRQSELEGKPDELDVVKRLGKLRYLIRLQLNPAGASDKEIESLIALIPDLTHESQTEQLKQKMNELIVVSQKLLTKSKRSRSAAT
jgi:hypothetical protein